MSLKESEAKRGRAEERLRRQLDLTRAITNSLGEGVFTLDPEGRVTFMNRAAEQMLGWKEPELLGKSMHETVHFQRPDGTPFPQAECPLLSVRESGVTCRVEDDAFTRKDGGLVHVAYTSSPVLTDGRVSGAVVAFRDVSERRRAEAQLREQQGRAERERERARQTEQLSQSVLNSLTAHIAVLDREGTIVAVNEAWRRFAEENGAPAARVGVGANYLQATRAAAERNDPHAREVLAGVGEVLAGGRDSFQLEYPCHAPKEARWFLLNANALLREHGGAVVSHLNITERVRAEQGARSSERRFRTLTDAMPQLVWATDGGGSHLYYNRRWYEFTGLTEEESLGLGFANALHPDDRERTLRRWESAWRDGEGYEIEYRFYSRPRDEYRWFLGRAVPVRDDAGRIVQWVGTCTDIEEQKRMEDALSHLNSERERLLEEVSTPVVPVLQGVLVLPIVGSLDTARMQKATDAALSEVRRTGAHACIIDITGARLIDSHAVANLTNLVGALRLVGAEAIVTGVGPHAAQSLVSLGVDLQGMQTRRTLAQALASFINHGTPPKGARPTNHKG
ncbi:MAG TPA: PAS domain S-box protein [Pyrinomonadaceae bacterium]|nr:PAS domain S-box protein [Pyrinomonadaceae bacterium]